MPTKRLWQRQNRAFRQNSTKAASTASLAGNRARRCKVERVLTMSYTPIRSLFALAMAALVAACAPASDTSQPSAAIAPIHLDDIHYIVRDEEAAVAFFEDNFGGREMAHPGERFDLARFVSLKWQGPTITITKTGPYEELPADRNQRWLEAEIIDPVSEIDQPVYGARWLAIATPSLEEARQSLSANGVQFAPGDVSLPMEPEAKTFGILGPDGALIVIVERVDMDFGEAQYAIDHIQFLVEDVEANAGFFAEIFGAETTATSDHSAELKVADAKLVLSLPEGLGLSADAVAPRAKEGAIRIGLDHLGFLYEDIKEAVDGASTNGRTPVFEPQRYIYRGKPTVYTFTAFRMPDDFSIEMVQADGRIGPHSYYIDQATKP